METPTTTSRSLWRRLVVPNLQPERLTTPSWERHRWPQVFVFVLAAAYATFFSWFSIGRAHNFNAGWYDLGIMTQTVWRVGHGLGLTFTNPELGPGGVHGWTALRTSTHTDFLLALLAPLSWFGHTAEALLVLQSVVLAFDGWFVWRIVTRLIGRPWLGVLIAAAFLAAPPLQFANLFEFHAVTLGITFVLAAVDALLARQDRLVWLWVGLALICKENVGITLGLLLGVLAWWQHRRRLGLSLLGICWAWVLLCVLVIIPLSRPNLPATFTNKFYGGGASEGGFSFLSQLTHPVNAWHKLITATHEHSAYQLLLPSGLLLPLLNPLILIAIPELLLYWLSDSPNQQTVVLHYHALIIPIIAVALLIGWRCWRMLWAQKWWPWLIDSIFIVLILAGTAFSAYRFGPLPGAGQTRWPLVVWKEHLTPQVTAALQLVPARASVATTQNLGPQLAQRPDVYLLPSGVKQSDYIVILERQFPADLKTNDKRLAEKVMLDSLEGWLNGSTAYTELYHVDRVLVYRRTGDDPRPLPVWPDHLLGQD